MHLSLSIRTPRSGRCDGVLDDLLAVTMVSAAGSCGNLRRRGTAPPGPSGRPIADEERDAAADRASRSAVSLAAVLVGVGGIDPRDEYDVSFRLRLYNAGHQPVDVTAAAIVGSGYLAPHDDAISKAVAQPQQWTALASIAGSPDCDTRAVALRALDEPSLRVNARTANGRERHVDVSLADPYDLLTSTRNAKCETPAVNAGMAPHIASVGPLRSGTSDLRQPRREPV